MTAAERQAAAVAVLIALESKIGHGEKCPAHKGGACNCHLVRNARTRAKALDDAGLLWGTDQDTS